MKILLTYDIKKTTNTIHTELKERLKVHYGYSERIISNEGKYYDLPNTALKKDNIACQDASKEFVMACNDVGAIWERYIAADYTLATFNNQ